MRGGRGEENLLWPSPILPLSLDTSRSLSPKPGGAKKTLFLSGFWHREAKAEEEEDGSNSSALHEHAMPGRQKTSADIPSPACI